MIVRDIMTKDVVTVAPTAALKAAAAMMLEHGISGVPVVDASGLVGVLSETDILFKERVHPERRRLLGRLLHDPNAPAAVKLDAQLVADAMTAPAVTIASGRPVSDAATTLLELGIDRLPVVDSGRLVGIVTRSDLVRAFIRSDEAIADEIRDDVVVRKAWGLTERNHRVRHAWRGGARGPRRFRAGREDTRLADTACSRGRRRPIAAELAGADAGMRKPQWPNT